MCKILIQPQIGSHGLQPLFPFFPSLLVQSFQVLSVPLQAGYRHRLWRTDHKNLSLIFQPFNLILKPAK